jgi:hypothetical protein
LVTRTITRLFDCDADAKNAVRNLEIIGIPRRNIIVVHDCDRSMERETRLDNGDIDHVVRIWAAAGLGTGIISGLTILGFSGLTSVIGMASFLAISALGFFGGTATGTITSALRVMDGDFNVCHDGLCSGTTLVSARFENEAIDQGREVFERRRFVRGSDAGSAINRKVRASRYRDEKQAYELDQAA